MRKPIKKTFAYKAHVGSLREAIKTIENSMYDDLGWDMVVIYHNVPSNNGCVEIPILTDIITYEPPTSHCSCNVSLRRFLMSWYKKRSSIFQIILNGDIIYTASTKIITNPNI